MIGIHVPGLGPVEFADSGNCGIAHAYGLRADECMFAIGLVPHGHDINALLCGEDESLQLCARLVTETIAYAERIFGESQHKFTMIRMWDATAGKSVAALCRQRL
jgi:hypothetical protein